MTENVIATGRRPVGRPRGKKEVVRVNFHCDPDLHEWLMQTKGDKSIIRHINDIIRKEAGL